MNALENHWIDDHKGIPPFSSFAANKMSKSGIELRRYVKNYFILFLICFLFKGSISRGIGIL